MDHVKRVKKIAAKAKLREATSKIVELTEKLERGEEIDFTKHSDIISNLVQSVEEVKNSEE